MFHDMKNFFEALFSGEGKLRGENNKKENHFVGRVDEIYKEIEKAKYNLEAAKNKFNNSTDPEQVDYSIYLLQVYEKRLEILYKELKDRNFEE